MCQWELLKQVHRHRKCSRCAPYLIRLISIRILFVCSHAGTAYSFWCRQDQIQGLCQDEAWQASSLKLLQERPFASLFSAELNDTVFDPTGLEQVDKNYYVVFKRCVRPLIGSIVHTITGIVFQMPTSTKVSQYCVPQYYVDLDFIVRYPQGTTDCSFSAFLSAAP